MDISEKLLHLRRNRLLQAFSAEELQQIHERFADRTFERNEAIFAAGEARDCVYLLKSGRVKISASDQSGKTFTHFIIEPGDAFGLLGMSNPGEHKVSAQALEQGAMCVIPTDDFAQLASARPAIGREVAKIVGERLERSRTTSESLIFADTAGRISRYLLDLAEREGTREDGAIIVRPNLRHQQIAELVGTTPQNFSRALRALVASQALDITKDGFRIRDIERLRRFVSDEHA